jgi:hypothetical protein
MIEGLKLTMTGDELRKRLAERIGEHERLVAHYKREAKREPNPKDEYDFVLPEHMCEYEVELHNWRAEALGYIRDHVESGEVYRLSETDLTFGEILPEKPGLIEQEEYEREQRAGYSLERIAKEIGRWHCGAESLAEAFAGERRVRVGGSLSRAEKRPRKTSSRKRKSA